MCIRDRLSAIDNLCQRKARQQTALRQLQHSLYGIFESALRLAVANWHTTQARSHSRAVDKGKAVRRLRNLFSQGLKRAQNAEIWHTVVVWRESVAAAEKKAQGHRMIVRTLFRRQHADLWVAVSNWVAAKARSCASTQREKLVSHVLKTQAHAKLHAK
eukprot:TRINITY_DN47413_c0_g1_i1.p1 TRINITY_DN47413_c0_g1~~TRINITY_DN47413_c0_g1_i1.p1  ORF type:complete len:159 (-),score=29.20 TRINITY_DN47413_c0_g1_i1:86-562(-)